MHSAYDHCGAHPLQPQVVARHGRPLCRPSGPSSECVSGAAVQGAAPGPITRKHVALLNLYDLLPAIGSCRLATLTHSSTAAQKAPLIHELHVVAPTMCMVNLAGGIPFERSADSALMITLVHAGSAGDRS